MIKISKDNLIKESFNPNLKKLEDLIYKKLNPKFNQLRKIYDDLLNIQVRFGDLSWASDVEDLDVEDYEYTYEMLDKIIDKLGEIQAIHLLHDLEER